jgi:hypothetical protein
LNCVGRGCKCLIESGLGCAVVMWTTVWTLTKNAAIWWRRKPFRIMVEPNGIEPSTS